MRLSLLCSCLLALVSATPAFAQTAPSSSTKPQAKQLVILQPYFRTHWRTMTLAEKQAVVRGLLEGIAADGALQGLLRNGEIMDPTTADMFNFLATHQDGLIAYADKAFSAPHQPAGLRACAMGYFLKSNPDYNARVIQNARKKLEGIEHMHPELFHSPMPSPSK